MTWITTFESAHHRLNSTRRQELEVRDLEVGLGDPEVVVETPTKFGAIGLFTRKFFGPKSVNDIQTWKTSG